MFKIICGDALDILKTLDDKSVRCCVTSPPYYWLRDYGIDKQIGMENTIGEYIDKLVSVFHEVKRVLTDDGTLWVNIGDSYLQNFRWGGDKDVVEKQLKSKGTHDFFKPQTKVNELPRKNLIGIPWRLAFALQDDGWILRQDIIWHKTNCMPESVRDRCVKCHEYIFLLAKNPTYFFDYKAIQEKTALNYSKEVGGSEGILGQPMSRRRSGNKERVVRPFPDAKMGGLAGSIPYEDITGMRNKRSVWSMATSGGGKNHYATFPEELPLNCILAGSERNDVVLDPFCGSGTTGKVALRCDRDFIGIDVNPEYCKLAEKKIMPYDEIRLF